MMYHESARRVDLDGADEHHALVGLLQGAAVIDGQPISLVAAERHVVARARDVSALRHVGLKPTAKIPIWNGPLECRFVRFDIFEGSLKNKKAREAEEQA